MTTAYATRPSEVTINPSMEGFLKPIAEGANISMQEALNFFNYNGLVLPETFQPLLALQIKCLRTLAGTVQSYPFVLSYAHSDFVLALTQAQELGYTEKEFLAPVREFYDKYYNSVKTSDGENITVRKPVVPKGVNETVYFAIPLVLGVENGELTFYRLQK